MFNAMLRQLLLVLACLVAAPAHAAVKPAQVIVLSTLHQMHDEIPAYSFQHLSDVIERLAPDVLCVEVRAEDLAARSPQKTKREYPAVIYPLIDKHRYLVYPMEPSEPAFSALVKPYMAANQAFAASTPAKAEALRGYGAGVYAGLRSYWTAPARVNDAITDQVMRAKHALQEAMIGPAERAGWQAWNQHFLGVITHAAAENPGKRIVVTVGAEHGYWLRDQIGTLPDVQLLDTAALLEEAQL